MLRSSIDLGTNTCLLLIAECDGAGRVTRVSSDHNRIVRLGQGVDRDRRLHPDAIGRALSCLSAYSGFVRDAGLRPSDTVCVATSQARDAANGREFFERVERETGFRFRVISGEEEARFTFRGALLSGDDPSRAAVIDIGGGSTEYMAESGGTSLDLGSVRFTERFLRSDPIEEDEFDACLGAIDAAIAGLKPWRERLPGGVELVAVAGTATTLAQWKLGLADFDAAAIDRCALTAADLRGQVAELAARSVKERLALPGVTEGRADVLLAGAMILWRSVEGLGFERCRVSTRGLRFGALEAFGPKGGNGA
jgi:exopolyphosphatase/guanosine-5'-triphosphate,3'-diphosphate pyrophosphatase